MSTKNKKAAATGVRYSDAQKNEIVNFVAQYNSANGRGGQAAAAKKFKVTPLTISGWLKGAGVKAAGKKAKPAKGAKASKPAPAAKPAKAAKPSKASKASANSKKGRRYSVQEKQEVIDFVNSWNASKGRGGQSQAAKKYNLSVLTVSSWLKGAGVSKPAKAAAAAKASAPAKAAAATAGLGAKVTALLQLGDQIRKVESELQQLRGRYDSLSASIRSSI